MKLFEKPLASLTSADTSRLIDAIKEVKAHRAPLATIVSESDT